jgi:hypothetical protein
VYFILQLDALREIAPSLASPVSSAIPRRSSLLLGGRNRCRAAYDRGL